MQILGGYGYCKEYNAERLMRECLVYPVYEGTSQIQALMAVKDLFKDIVESPRKFFDSLLSSTYQRFSQRDPVHKKLQQLRQLSKQATLKVLLQLIRCNFKMSLNDLSTTDVPKIIKVLTENFTQFEDYTPVFLHAERLCEMLSLEACSESLLADLDLDPNRRNVSERFINQAVPRAEYLKSCIEINEETINEKINKTTNK